MKLMTLDEAILHAEEIADRCAVTDGDRECEHNHRLLAEWLKAYKEITDHHTCRDCRKIKCEYKPEPGQLMRFNCPLWSDRPYTEVLT